MQHNTKGSLIYCVGAHLVFCGPHKRLSLHCCTTNKFRQVGSSLVKKKKKKFALSEQSEENNALCAAFVTLNRVEMFLFPMGTSIFPIHCHYDQEQFKAVCKEDCTSCRSKVSVLGAIQISFPFVICFSISYET